MAIWGLIANLIGTLILGFAMGTYYKWVNYSLAAYETFMETYAKGGDVLALCGTRVHRNGKYREANKWMILGAALILAGFGMHIYAMINMLK